MARRPPKPLIEPRVQAVCAAMNSLLGIYTFSSCGGHKKPKIVSQCRANEFFVCFDVDRSKVGWTSLEIITWASYRITKGRVEVHAWLSGDEPDTMAFEIKGRRGADPDEIAYIISELFEDQPTTSTS